MGDIVAVDNAAGIINDGAELSREISEPNAETRSASSKTARIITVNVGVLIVAETVDFVGNILGNAGGGIHAVDEFARKRLVVTLSCREIVVVMIKTGMEASIGWVHARDVVESSVEGGGSRQVSGPVDSRFDAIEEVARYRAGVGGFKRVIAARLDMLVECAT